MGAWRRALPGLALFLGTLAATATRAPAGSLTTSGVEQLLQGGVGEDVIRQFAADHGFVGPMEVSDVITLRADGATDGLLQYLMRSLAPAPSAPPAGITVRDEDGVTVVSGSSVPGEGARSNPGDGSAGSPATDESATPPSSTTPVAGAPVATTPAPVVVVGAPAGGDTNPWDGHGYPLGAAIGPSGSVIFLPASFGAGPPSAFGRTVVNLVPGGWPVMTPCCTTCPQLAAVPQAEAGHWETIQTSHGPIRVPN